MTDLHTPARVFIVGGAGFIGSHFVDRLLVGPTTEGVTIYDNFTSGRPWHYAHHADDPRLAVVEGEVGDLDSLTNAMVGHDTVIHLASNPDIARAMTEPAVDFDQGTLLTHHVVEAMRRSEVRGILYASGSGVYGDLGELEAEEDYGPLVPVSTYGASKLAGEALIASYCHMFDLVGCVFRFGNVVGPRQTHGVGFDFVRRLLQDPSRLEILGDGQQSKSYVHVEDVVNAVLLAASRAPRPFAAFNVATGDYITVTEIARVALEVVGLTEDETTFAYSGGSRGWKGDVPVVRLNTAHPGPRVVQPTDLAPSPRRLHGRNARGRSRREADDLVSPQPRSRAVFLDRDGVLNEVTMRDGVPRPPASVDDLVILPDVEEACQGLSAAGFALIVVTNQPDVARGSTTLEAVQRINAEVQSRLPLDGVYVCPHDDEDRCGCRKPSPGLLLAAARDHSLDLGASFLVGDRWRDIGAGRAAGCTTVLVDREYHESHQVEPDIVAGGLAEAAKWILGSVSDPTQEHRNA